MSYHTYLDGEFTLNKPLDDTTYWDLIKEHDTRHEDDIPSIWNHWIPTEDRLHIKCDDMDDASFYNYDEWIKLLIDRFLAPRGYILKGTVKWEGEEQGDVGKLIIKNNVLTVKKARLVYD